jgi:DNA-binding NarL/FixJ family response regulator
MAVTKKHKIFIVDDHNLFRNGLKFIMEDMDDVEVIAEASNGQEFLELLDVVNPDLVLMDISMPVMNGVEATRIGLERKPDLNILILTMFGEDAYYNTMIELGVKGFLLKDAENQELKDGIRTILKGGTYFSQELLLNLIKHRSDNNPVTLTRREQEVLALICKGYSNSQISDELHISQRTVERHRSNLLLKTESNNSISLVVYAIKNNLVSI